MNMHEKMIQTYTMSKANAENTLIIKIKDLYDVFQNKIVEGRKSKLVGLYNCTLCKIHGIRTIPEESVGSDDASAREECCVDSCQYNECFGVDVFGELFMYPPPMFFNMKNYSFFRSHIEFIYKLYDDMINNVQIDKKFNFLKHKDNPKKMISEFFNYVRTKTYRNFMENDFKMGNFKLLQSGKRSYMRFHLLGHKLNGTRMTMTVNNQLGPNQISIPRSVYDQLNLATTLVVAKRDPSINDNSVYVCDLSFHETDACIHLNPFILDGLHADQDGDEIPLYYLKYESSIPSPEMKMAIYELKALSWGVGRRFNLLYKPKYSFGQQYRHLLYTHDDWFKRRSPFYNHISDIFQDKNEKIDALMALACTVYRQEVDDFIRLVLCFNSLYRDPCLALSDYVQCNDEIVQVYKSKSKGSKRHLDLYLAGLSKQKEFGDFMFSFNNKIESSKILEKEGQTQFSLLHSLTPVNLLCKNLIISNQLLVENYTDLDIMSEYNYDVHFVKYVVRVMKSACGGDINVAMSNLNSMPKLRNLMWLLIKSKNPFFMSLDNLPFGVHMCILTQSQKIQSALNVKRLKDLENEVSVMKGTMQPIIPKICIKWLYKHKEYNWFRVQLRKGACAQQVYENLGKVLNDIYGYTVLFNDVVEFYFTNSASLVRVMFQIDRIQNCTDVHRIIFMSNCSILKRLNLSGRIDNQAFLDNVTSFLYCYFKNSICVDHNNVEFLHLYSFISLMLLVNKNLNNPTGSSTIPPLHSMSGEFPMRVINNFIKSDKRLIHFVKTAREFRCMGQPADYFAGTNSAVIFLIYESELYRSIKRDGGAHSTMKMTRDSVTSDMTDIELRTNKDAITKDYCIIASYLLNGDNIKEFLMHLVNCEIYQKYKKEYKVLQIKLSIDKICTVIYKFIKYDKISKTMDVDGEEGRDGVNDSTSSTSKISKLVCEVKFNECTRNEDPFPMSKVYITFENEHGEVFIETHTGQYFGNHYRVGKLQKKMMSSVGENAVDLNCQHEFKKYEQNDRAGDEAVTIKTICIKCGVNAGDAKKTKIINYGDIKKMSQLIKSTFKMDGVNVDNLSRLILKCNNE